MSFIKSRSLWYSLHLNAEAMKKWKSYDSANINKIPPLATAKQKHLSNAVVYLKLDIRHEMTE